MPRGFCHDDDWFDILWQLCEDFEPLVAEFGSPLDANSKSCK